ncbi:MAG: BCD family MFS transporter [Prochlorotrichaceae cyanobacterium]
MTHFDSATPPSDRPQDLPPPLPLFLMFRLGIFQMGLGIMSVLTLGLLNRVMVSELEIPLGVTAGIIAMHQFVAPARVWFGQLSDAKPIQGLHRTGYVWIGSLLFTTIAFLAVQAMWQLGDRVAALGSWQFSDPSIQLWVFILGAIFVGYGFSLSCSSTPFAALLVDVSEEHERSKLVSIVWSMLMVGIVIGAILTGIMLKKVGIDAEIAVIKASLNRLFLMVPAIIIVLTLLSTWGVEQRYSHYRERSHLAADREDQISLGRALRVLTASRQTGLFFSFLLVMSLGLFIQEAVLENYGAEIFQMPMAETTSLNAFFGMGTLLGLGLTGFFIVPRIGKINTTRLGCTLVAIAFVLMILAGFNQTPQLLKVMVGLFGLASGVTTTGAISLMLDLTAAETAGTFIGAWGLAQALARASATWLGGLIKSLGDVLFSNALAPYALVFGLEIVAMIAAIGLLGRVNVREFQDRTSVAIAQVLQTEMD